MNDDAASLSPPAVAPDSGAVPCAPHPALDQVGPARDFAAFCELERERRRSSDDDFDPERFDAALALVLAKLGGPAA